MKFAGKVGELEVSTEQPQTPKEALGAVAIEAKLIGSGSPKPIDEDEPVTSVAPDNSDIKAWLAAELERRELEATSWKNVFLDQFLVDAKQLSITAMLSSSESAANA